MPHDYVKIKAQTCHGTIDSPDSDVLCDSGKFNFSTEYAATEKKVVFVGNQKLQIFTPEQNL